MNTVNKGKVIEIENRKNDHIDISLNRDVSYRRLTTGFEDYRFIHQALPEINLDDIDTSIVFLGKKLGAPLFISSMVGGVDKSARINCNLAIAAQHFSLAMGVGSQRCAVDDEKCEYSFRIRHVAPDIFLCANLGAVQLNYGYSIDQCRRAVDMIEANALILHLNPLQEALQIQGNTKFSGLISKIETLCSRLTVPVIVKEVCFGISERTARDLKDAGISALDIAGSGGTSWSEVERYRVARGLWDEVASAFADWGIPTSDSLQMARSGAPGIPIIASGGVRSGIDAAKAIALGADLAGLALPLLKAAQESAEKVIHVLNVIIHILRLTMFCTGSENITKLQNTSTLVKTRG